MIELSQDCLVFTFPEVHRHAVLRVDFQRTLRIPDDDRDYPLPPGLGRFPLRLVDDYAQRVPEAWMRHGGVLLPMYQSEALWIYFDTPRGYPFAVKVATGKINAATGEAWHEGLHRKPQDYVVAPGQPWLDGYCVENGVIRQFVAMPLGSGYSVEEQLTGAAEYGGLQFMAYPMKAEAYGRLLQARRSERLRDFALYDAARGATVSASMGLGAGGRMRQQIFRDRYDMSDWDLERSSRCFVHIANSLVWRALTGEQPPTVPPTAKEYTRMGLPWFDYYSEDLEALEGAEKLAPVKSVKQMGVEKGDVPLPENESVDPANVVKLRKGLKPGQVREGAF